MTRTLAELEQLATDCMESNNPNVQERHRGAGACARAAAAAEHERSRWFNRNQEAAALLEALELHAAGEPDELTTAELLLTAAMIAARAEGAELELGASAELLEAGDTLAECIDLALETHIYEPGEVPPDSGELLALEHWKRLRAVTDETVAPYDTHRARLKAEGFRLGSDADGFDVYRRADCSGARAWIKYEGGDDRFIVERAALVGSSAHVEQLTDTRRAPIPPPEDEPEALFRNHYKCASCGHEWEDEWSCACDDDCPECGARHMTPIRSEELEPTSYDA